MFTAPQHTNTISEDSATFSVSPGKEALRKHLERMREEEKRLDQERKEGRKLGKLTNSLREKLCSCNPLQLRRVKKLCDEYLADHRAPPAKHECQRRTAKALSSWCMKNKRYQLELRRCGRKKCQSCPHGPYLYVYHRDGSIIKEEYVKESNYHHLPRRIRKEVKAYLSSLSND